MAKVCRKYLIPDPGNTFFIIDWKQQELRILADASDEPTLKNTFATDKWPENDPHVMAFETVTGRRWEGRVVASSESQLNMSRLQRDSRQDAQLRTHIRDGRSGSWADAYESRMTKPRT